MSGMELCSLGIVTRSFGSDTLCHAEKLGGAEKTAIVGGNIFASHRLVASVHI